MSFQVDQAWNSRSEWMVSTHDVNGDPVYLGTVYLPRGRKWGTIAERGHPAFKDVIGHCDSVRTGAEMLYNRFLQGMNPKYKP
jgi:hypothetical protein